MTDKSYPITISLLRISLLAGQLAVSPSAAAADARQQPALGACPAFVAGKEHRQLEIGISIARPTGRLVAPAPLCPESDGRSTRSICR